MNQLVALGVENKPINALGAFRDGAATAAGIDQAKKEAAQQAMGMIGSIALGAMGGDMNGQADPKMYEEGLNILEGYGIDVAPFRGKPQLAPVAARASLTTMQQIANASDQKSMDLALEKFERGIMESDRSYGIDRETLDFNKQKALVREPQSTLGKLAADLNAGLITKQEYDAGIEKATRDESTTINVGDIKEGPAKAAGFYERMSGSEAELAKIKGSVNPAVGRNTVDGLWQSMAPNELQKPEFQAYKAAAAEWIRAKLRKESGAAIPDSEMAAEFETYFPVPGDDPDTVKLKERLRATATETMLAESRGAHEALFGGETGAPSGRPTMTINGVVYEKDAAGEWYEAE